MCLRDRMRRELPVALRARDRTRVAALRSALAAIDNAEAVPTEAATIHAVGLGAAETARGELSETHIAAIVAAEITERRDIAARYSGTEHAARLHAEAEILAALLDADPTPPAAS